MGRKRAYDPGSTEQAPSQGDDMPEQKQHNERDAFPENEGLKKKRREAADGADREAGEGRAT